MTPKSRLEALSGAIQVAGGLRLVAKASHIDASNLHKYVRTGRGLSEERLERLYITLGCPGGRLPKNTVTVIRPKWVNLELAQALSWYFPEGGQVARATWSGMGWEHIKKVLTVDLTPGLYAIRNQNEERILVILPASLLFPRKLFPNICPDLHWRGGEPERAELQFDDATPWINGVVSQAEFDEAWPDPTYDPTSEDLLRHVRELKLSWAEAIRRITYNL